MVQTPSRYWNTKDGPTNANLEYLESLALPWDGMTAEHFLDKIRGVIRVERMLPRVVRGHFRLPYLFVGDAPYDWSPTRLLEETTRLCSALAEGLASAHADPSLRREGDADLSDRPATKGEEIKVVVQAYRESRSSAALGTLRQAVFGTSLHRYMDQLDKWLARKRPSSPHRSIEYEIICVIGDIERRAGDFHHEPASYNFAGRAVRP